MSTPLVLIGDEVTDLPDSYLTGHGVYEDDGKVFVARVGTLVHIEKLVYVKALHSRYEATVGDVVIGRVAEIQSNRWMLDIQGSQRGQLPLGSVWIPGSEQRIKTDSDQLKMREHFQESDLVLCEVQRVQQDNQSVSLHTRSSRYGRLENGCLTIVPCELVPSQEKHMELYPNGVYVILGRNGYIWTGSPPIESEEDALNSAVHEAHVYREVTRDLRVPIIRTRNCIRLLADHQVAINKKNILALCALSVNEDLPVARLLDPCVGHGLVRRALHVSNSVPS